MRYMLQIYSSESSWTKEEWTQCTKDSTALCHELNEKRQFRAASPLHPVAEAVTVRVRNGERLVTAGPYAETTEQLGGYYIIDVPDLDEAIQIAGRLPPAKKGVVEIRPILEIEGLPEDKRHPPAEKGNTKVMFLCYDDEQHWNNVGEETMRAAMNEAIRLTHELDCQGRYHTCSPLYRSETATCVRVRNGQRIVSDGPYAETHEVLGGYYVLSFPSIEEAVNVAARHPGVYVGAVEIRPIYELPNLPE